MAKQSIQQETKGRTELQELIEKMRLNNWHLHNLFEMAVDQREEKMGTIISCARRYLNDDHEVWCRVEEIVDLQAKEGGA